MSLPARLFLRSVPAALACLLLAAAAAHAGQDQESSSGEEKRRRVELRVSSVAPGARLVVDRGASDGIEAGDLVRLFPREGGVVEGRVTRVEERRSLVFLREKGNVPPPGTRGEVWIPTDRLAGRAEADPGPGEDEAEEDPDDVPAGTGDEETEKSGEGLPWRSKDPGYTPDLPLLAQVKPVRPEERGRRLGGRFFVDSHGTATTDGGRADTLLRLGTELRLENPFGLGGEIDFDVEAYHRFLDVPDQGSDDELDLRVDRLSYARGGTRFEGDRIELGRFLQRGLPEFGFLDGVEYGRRRRNGDRYGASIGFQPEPDFEFQTGSDFQLAGHYLWVLGDQEELTLGGGFQKTWHNGAADRDLLIAKLDYVPREGWDVRGSVWVDFYSGGDDDKDSSVEPTFVLLSTGKRWKNGNAVDVALRHVSIPQIDRNEFTPILAAELADDRHDRISVSGWAWGGDQRWFGEVGAWNDEDDTGGDAEAGVEIRDLFAEGARGEVSLFGSLGRFETAVGARAAYGSLDENGGWDVFYEIANHRQEGFSSDFDDLLQQRLRGSRDVFTVAGWSFSAYGEIAYWDEDASFTAGLYLQRIF